jgi:hypothetical protein
MKHNWTETQPLGLQELEENAAVRYKLEARDSLILNDGIRCCVRGCHRRLAKRRRGPSDTNAFCPNHGVSVSTSPTYVYKDYRHNFITDVPALERVKGLKIESWRLGNERSEDALSWNVFVGLAGLNGLGAAFQSLTGIEVDGETELYLWGVRISDEEPRVWDRLKCARRHLEEGAGWPTEPDVILRVPGRAIVLIEAKFGSANGTMLGNEERFGAVAEFLDRYPRVVGKTDPLNRAWIEEQPPGQVLQQLLRNVIFAQWLAEQDEVPLVVNLVLETEEREVGERLTPQLAADSPVLFRRCTWEGLFQLPLLSREEAKPLRRYIENKTNRLVKAFEVPNLGSTPQT